MPASLPGATLAENIATPAAGPVVLFGALTGPKGAPKDWDDMILSWDANNHPVYTRGTVTRASTGGLSTGIGFGASQIAAGPAVPFVAGGTLKSLGGGNFTDDYTPGSTKPDGTATTDSTYVYIGGGRSGTIAANAVGGQTGVVPNTPYTAGYGIAAAGQGGDRESGTAGFPIKAVTAAAGVAAGAVVETGWVNRSGAALVTGQSVFGVGSTALTAPAETEEPPPPPVEEPPPAPMQSRAKAR